MQVTHTLAFISLGSWCLLILSLPIRKKWISAHWWKCSRLYSDSRNQSNCTASLHL